ncbi:hypothetical protein AAVH_23375 [Aphelenchoides avenae]|nr:hypothetical protein AAVH_23375 [Aphelenchus avenae]
MRSASAREFMCCLAAKGLRSLSVLQLCGGDGCTGTQLLAFMTSATQERSLVLSEESVRLSRRFVHKLVEAAKTGKLCDFDARISDRSVAELDMSGYGRYRTSRPTFLQSSLAAYDIKPLGLKLTFTRDSTALQVSYRKTEK